MQRIRKENPNDDAADALSMLVENCVGVFRWKPSTLRSDLVVIKNNELIVRASQHQHQQIGQLLKRWEEFGLRPIVVEILFVFTQESFNSFVPTEGGRIVSVAPPQEIDAMSIFGDAQSVRNSVSCPTFTRIMSNADVERTKSILQGQPRSNLLFAPKVTIYNGSTAICSDTRKRPFVTGLDTSETGKVIPQISSIEEGLQIAVQGLVADNSGAIEIELQVRRREITDVEVLTTRIEGMDRETQIQIPHISESNFRSRLKLAPDQSTLVAPLRRDAQGNMHLCLIKAWIPNQ